MERVTAELYEYLQKNNIDPDNVTMVLRCTDQMTDQALTQTIKRDLQPMNVVGTIGPYLRGLQIHGIKIAITAA